MRNYFIKPGYRIREKPVYCDDREYSESGILWQPDVYPFAAYLARHFRCSYIIDIGCGVAQKLVKLHPEFQVIGIDFKDNIQYSQKEFQFGQWIEWDLDKPGVIPICPEILSNSVIICSDVIEHLIHPDFLLENLKTCLAYAPAALLSTPERDLTYGLKNIGPPPNPKHIREWNESELESLLRSYDFHIEFMGLTMSNNKDWRKKTLLAILGNNQQPEICPAPADFRVISIMTASNEGDIILSSLNYLISNSIEAYVINSGSNDSIGNLARSLLGKGVIGVEDFHSDGSTFNVQHERLLDRVAEISSTLKADWFIHQNANELNESPWPGLKLKDAIYYADQCGFNCIDHTILNFSLVDDGFQSDTDFSTYYKYYELVTGPDQPQQVNVWKNLNQRIHLTHERDCSIDFEGSYVFPYKFLMKRYILSSSHDRCIESGGTWQKLQSFFGKGRLYTGFFHEGQRAGLSLFDPSSFYKNFLVERLCGLNLPRSIKLDT
ncbi:MAG: methyltransferase domain-containing protein [Ktedonobacteraceae bacterium]